MATSPYEKAVGTLLAKLPERNREVLKRRYGLFQSKPETLEEIGEEYGVTRERIRQIEANAFVQLRENHGEFVQPMFRELERHLRDHGSLRAEHRFFEDFSPRVAPSTLQFLLDLGDPFSRHRETSERHAVWTLDAKHVAEAEEFERAVVAKLQSVAREFKEAEFWNLVEEEARRLKLALSERARQSWIGISRSIARGPRNTWGLVKWPEIEPNNVGDWAFIVMRSANEPMHFSDIVDRMNALGAREGRRAHLQTVHNELIKDPRFVLVGRGLYALREWGYEPGTVRDVLVRILRDAKRPMERDEILAHVAKVRRVQPNTVVLNLQNKAMFLRTADGRFGLRRA